MVDIFTTCCGSRSKEDLGFVSLDTAEATQEEALLSTHPKIQMLMRDLEDFDKQLKGFLKASGIRMDDLI